MPPKKRKTRSTAPELPEKQTGDESATDCGYTESDLDTPNKGVSKKKERKPKPVLNLTYSDKDIERQKELVAKSPEGKAKSVAKTLLQIMETTHKQEHAAHEQALDEWYQHTHLNSFRRNLKSMVWHELEAEAKKALLQKEHFKRFDYGTLYAEEREKQAKEMASTAEASSAKRRAREKQQREKERENKNKQKSAKSAAGAGAGN
jgi:hypothetical protein